MSITIKLASAAPVLAARASTGELDPNLTGVLQDINNASFALTFFPLAAMLAAFALVAIRSTALPGWLGWAAAPLSVAFAVGGLAGSADLASEWAGLPMLIFTPWVIATSVVLIRRARAATPVATLPAGPEELGRHPPAGRRACDEVAVQPQAAEGPLRGHRDDGCADAAHHPRRCSRWGRCRRDTAWRRTQARAGLCPSRRFLLGACARARSDRREPAAPDGFTGQRRGPRLPGQRAPRAGSGAADPEGDRGLLSRPRDPPGGDTGERAGSAAGNRPEWQGLPARGPLRLRTHRPRRNRQRIRGGDRAGDPTRPQGRAAAAQRCDLPVHRR